MPRETPVRDEMWYALCQEMRTHREDEGLFTRVVLYQGISPHHLVIQGEVWRTENGKPTRRQYTYSREWPHGDARTLCTACFQVLAKTWTEFDKGARDGLRTT